MPFISQERLERLEDAKTQIDKTISTLSSAGVPDADTPSAAGAADKIANDPKPSKPKSKKSGGKVGYNGFNQMLCNFEEER